MSSIKVGKLTFAIWQLGDGRYAFDYKEGTKRKIVARTHFEDLKSAAAEIAVKILNGETEALQLTPQDCRIHVAAIDAISPWRQLAVDGVCRDVARAYEKIGRVVPISEMADAWLSRQVPTITLPATTDLVKNLVASLSEELRSDKYVVNLKRDLNPFALAVPDLSAATEESLREYLRSLRTKPDKAGRTRPVGPRRRDNVRDAIVRLFSFAYPDQKKTLAQKIDRLDAGDETVSTYTPAELSIMLEHVSTRWRPWMAIGAFAGLRTSEIFRLDWAHVKWQQRVIAVTRKVAKKVRISRLVPMSENLLVWLAGCRDNIGRLYPAKTWSALESAHRRELKRLRKVTGLQWDNNALRHSFGSHRLAIVKSYAQVALEMGNSEGRVREDYNDPKDEEEGRNYFAILPPEAVDNVIPLPLEFRA